MILDLTWREDMGFFFNHGMWLKRQGPNFKDKTFNFH